MTFHYPLRVCYFLQNEKTLGWLEKIKAVVPDQYLEEVNLVCFYTFPVMNQQKPPTSDRTTCINTFSSWSNICHCLFWQASSTLLSLRLPPKCMLIAINSNWPLRVKTEGNKTHVPLYRYIAGSWTPPPKKKYVLKNDILQVNNLISNI